MFRVIKNIFRKENIESADHPPLTEYTAAEAGFCVFREDDVVSFALGQNRVPVFQVDGPIAISAPELSRRKREGGEAYVYKFGPYFTVTFIPAAEKTDFTQEYTVKKAVSMKGCGGRWGIDIRAAFGANCVRYLIEIDGNCAIKGMQEINFKENREHIEIPSLEEMVSILHSIIDQKRTVISCMHGFIRRCSDYSVFNVVNFIKEQFAEHEELLQGEVSEAELRIKSSGRSVGAPVMRAVCIIADIFLGSITTDSLRHCLAKQQIVQISAAAVEAAVAFFNEIAPEDITDEKIRQACLFLNSTGKGRTFRSTICDIVEDGDRKTSVSALRKLLKVVPDNDEGLASRRCALCSLLEANGKKIAPDTISALCLFVDLEAHIIDEDLIEQFLPETYLSEHSLYATMAVGQVFGLNLTSFSLKGKTYDSILYDFNKLLSISKHGALALFIDSRQDAFKILYVKDSKELQDLCATDYTFTGIIIVDIPIIYRVSTLDMAFFLQKGIPILTRFCEEGGALRWSVFSAKQVGELPFSVVGRYGFIDGYKVCRFNNRVVGRLLNCTAEQLIGKTKIAAEYVDAQGNVCYRFIDSVEKVDDILQADDSSLKFNGRIVEFPLFKSFASRILESSIDTLAGLDSFEKKTTSRLDLCCLGAWAALTEDSNLVSAAQDQKVLNVLRRQIRSTELAATLGGAVSSSVCWRLGILLGPKDHKLHGDLKLSPALTAACHIESFAKVAAMIVLGNILSCPGAILNSQYLLWNPSLMRSLIQKELFKLIDGGTGKVRKAACYFLASNLFVSDKDSFETSAAKLRSLLNDKYLEEVAAHALARLSLALTVHIPAEAQVEGWDRAENSDAADLESAEEIAANVNSWLDDPDKSPQDKLIEAPALANIRGEKPKIKLLSKYIIKVNGAFQRESSSGVHSYIILPPNFANTQRQKLVAAWRSFLSGRNLPLSSKDYGMNIFDSFLNYLPGYEQTSQNEIALQDLDIFDLTSGYKLAPGSDPFFIKLASLIPPPARTGDFESSTLPVICRSPYKLADGEAVDLGICEVLNVESNEWVPFLDFRFCMALHLSAENRILYETLGYLYTRVVKAKQADSVREESVAEFSAELIAADTKEVIATDQKCRMCLTLESTAERLASSFQIDSDSIAKVQHILLGVRNQSLYKLPGGVEVR
ncbi:MAG: hypothetical protein ACI376_08235 [Candidatus Bruticola sp.]